MMHICIKKIFFTIIAAIMLRFRNLFPRPVARNAVDSLP